MLCRELFFKLKQNIHSFLKGVMQDYYELVRLPSVIRGVIKMAREQYFKTKKEHIYHYKNSRGEKRFAYRYKYYDNNKVRNEKSGKDFLTEKDAERALIEVKADILDGHVTYIQNSNQSLADWMNRYRDIRSKRWKISTLTHYNESINNHVIPLIGHNKLTKLTNLIIQEEFVDELLDKGLKKATIRNILRILNAALNYAVKTEILKRNPITELNFDEAKEVERDQYYSEEELNDFLSAVKQDGSPTRIALFTLLAMTGMRRGEAMALYWSDIDFVEKTISITKTRDRYGERDPKTKRSIRKVHINDVLATELKVYYNWTVKEKWKRSIEPKNGDVVFITVKGLRPIADCYTKDAMAHISNKYHIRRIKTHGLRHTFASILLSRNVPLITVAEMLGDHPNTVNNIYAHSLVKKETEASDLLNLIVQKQQQIL